MNHPEVVSIGLIWDSECPTLQHITDVFHSIGMYLSLQDMFHNVFDVEWASATTLQLVGVVTYYGKHYSTFFFHTKLRVWIYFDDATVREVGPSWEQVVEKCQKGRFQPLLLLFANPDSSGDYGKKDHSVINLSNPSDSTSSCTPLNQRQAVIRQYLMLQNSYQESSSKALYGPMRNVDIHPNNNAHQTYLQNAYRMDQGQVPHSANYSVNPALSYSNQTWTINAKSNQPPPVYSNLQYLNSLQHNQNQVDLSKLNEVSLPIVEELLPPNTRTNMIPTDVQQYEALNAYEMQNKDKNYFDCAKDSDSAFTEDDPEGNDMYISRKTVENVLNQQKRQMSLSRSYSQGSVGNRNSSSSLESFDNQANKLNAVKNPVLENIPSRRDSGSWSSDRNSSSSNNSVENPFLTVVASKRLLLGLNKKGQVPDYSNTNTSDHGYDSYSVSSSDSYPSVNGSPVKLDPRLTQIPEDWQPEDDNDLDQKLKLVTEDTSGPPDCDKLCAEADLLLAKSHEKEKDGDLVMAALLCDSAAARARAAMEAPYNNSRSLVSAKMKHSTCVMRSSNLYRRLKDHEMEERRKQKGHTGHHSRQSSRDSTHSRHSRQGSKDSTHSKSGSKDSNPNSDDTENFGKSIEIYGTLPKKGSRKKSSTPSGSLKVKDDQVYKDFLDKQRKNTNLSNALNETMLKNVDVPQTRSDSNSKIKNAANGEKPHRKSYPEGPQKLPTRKKDSSAKSDPEIRRKSPKQFPEQTVSSPPIETMMSGTEMNNKDLLSPVTSPDKKQHKIKRKLMGGFMKRKNRSLPDLREDQDLSDPMDRFLDDAIIQVPSTMMLPNGKSKKIENQGDASIGNITRGFHQPHHAFVKKDLTQRPLLMKVNPPNVQPAILSNPKTKLVHTLPSLPKKVQDGNIKLDSNSNTNIKPSKIPFISTLPKNDSGNLPPISPPKISDVKCTIKPALSHKASAIPVLSPQIPLSPIKYPHPKEDIEAISNPLSPAADHQLNEKDELPQPSNPFLAELQAKRKQVLNRSQQKQDVMEKVQSSTTTSAEPNEIKELSMLPKLALQAEGTSWLKELQSKQQQILQKQDNIALSKQVSILDRQPMKTIVKGNEIITENAAVKPIAKNLKLHSENASAADVASSPNTESSTTSKTSGSVKDLASRFEKVLIKPKERIQNTTFLEGNSMEPSAIQTNSQKQSFPLQYAEIEQNTKVAEIERNPVSASYCDIKDGTGSPLSLKSAIKFKFDHDQENESKNSEFQKTALNSDSVALPSNEAKTIKSVLKQSKCQNSDFESSNCATILPCRPMQPPDYATAMQRLELIRTSPNEANRQQTEHCSQIPNKLSESPKKKQGPKKTVTFSDEVVLVACAEYDEIDFSSNPLFERVYQQHMEAGKGEIPILSTTYGNAATKNKRDDSGITSNIGNINLSSPCNLCHTKNVIPPNTYCTDCEFYLSRFKP
ncbi:Inactive ubiquitin carboxyl-terminal hydrolase 54, partial [Stegodyphus mimosarum]